MYSALRETISVPSFIGEDFNGYVVKSAEDFSYIDPVDGSKSSNQGLLITFTNGSRIIFRLSGTGSHGATIRLYVEKYDPNDWSLATSDAVSELINIALKLSKLQEFTARTSPTVHFTVTVGHNLISILSAVESIYWLFV